MFDCILVDCDEASLAIAAITAVQHVLHSNPFCQVLYVLTRLLGALRSKPRQFVNCLAINRVSASKSEFSQTLLTILARHRRALLGKNFYQDPTTDEFKQFKDFVFLDVITQVSQLELT